MRLAISVYRYGGDRDGGEISEPLLGESLVAALARGRAELDATAASRRTVTLDVAFSAAYRLGALVELDDPIVGVPWRGKITGIAHQDTAGGDGGVLMTTLTVERSDAK